MRKELILIALLTLLLSACSDYSDHKIKIGETPTFGIFDDINIVIGVQGKNELNYSVELLYKGNLLTQDSITSSFKSSLSQFSIDLSKIQDKSIDLAYDIINQNNILIDIVLSNENEKIALDSSMHISFRPPPISQPLSIELSNGKSDLTSPIQSSMIEVRKKFPNIDGKTVYRIAFLSEILKQSKKGLHVQFNGKQLKPVKKGFDISATLNTDTIYKHTVVGRYPAFNNSYYDDVNLEKMISEYIETKLDSIKSDWKGKMNNGAYVITDNLSSEYVGLIGVYLINIDQFGQFTYQQLGAYLSDAVSPKFSNSTYCSEPNNPEYEGVLCLDKQHFYGWSPFKVPFTGRAYGDIKSIYVDGMKVDFEIGKEIYFKKSVYLDGGYNRVPIKIIDMTGNITESFIPITIKDMDNDKIDIENNINIDNY